MPRSLILHVRLSPKERRQLLLRARACGRGLSTFLRDAALGSLPRQSRDHDRQHALAAVAHALLDLDRALPLATQAPELRDHLLAARRRLHHVLRSLR